MKRISIIAGLVSCMGLLFCWSAQAGKLHDAADQGDVAKVRHLLEKGADVNARSGDWRQQTPLHLAAYDIGNTEVAKLLIAKGADVNARDENLATPLHNAALNGNPEMAKLLIAKGADVNATALLFTPAMLAEQQNHPETAAVIRQAGGR